MMPRKKVTSKNDRTMPMVHPNAAAIDVGATLLMAAVRADRTSEPVRSFGTFTTDLHRLAAWFAECGVETVAMESTSVYWVPIYELLDARGFTVFLVNARDAKHVPGRKTDVSDAQWLQRLHSYGLLRASFCERFRMPAHAEPLSMRHGPVFENVRGRNTRGAGHRRRLSLWRFQQFWRQACSGSGLQKAARKGWALRA
jgi:hypothetical protein